MFFLLFHPSLLEHSKNKVISWRNVKEILVHFHHSLLRVHGQRVEEYWTVVEAVDPYSFIDFLVILATISLLDGLDSFFVQKNVQDTMLHFWMNASL